jgi:hypothetical protein
VCPQRFGGSTNVKDMATKIEQANVENDNCQTSDAPLPRRSGRVPVRPA